MNSSILASVLKEELLRNQEKQRIFLKELKDHKKSYISKKKIKGKIYLYLQARNGKKIQSHYIGRYSFDKLQEAIQSIEHRNKMFQEFQFLKKEEKILTVAIQSYDR